jgi:hypothetical protein
MPMSLRVISLSFCFWLGFASDGRTQSQLSFDDCVRIITHFCGPVASSSEYVQVNLRTETGKVLEDIDRGWILSKSEDMLTILNDRLLVRSYSFRATVPNSPSFEFASRVDEPLSKAEHALMVEKRRLNTEMLLESNVVFRYDFGRYPQFRAETSRLVHILLRSQTRPSTIDDLLHNSQDLDFESAYHFVINGCDPFRPNESWEGKAKCCLANCFLTQVFAKISDSQRVHVDDCLKHVDKLIAITESQTIDCSRLTELKTLHQRLLIWKQEKESVENRLSYFPTPHDVVLDFLMSRGNIVVGRATLFEDDHYVELERLWSDQRNVLSGKSLWGSTIPSRFVVASRGEGPAILSVGDVLEICSPKELSTTK